MISQTCILIQSYHKYKMSKEVKQQNRQGLNEQAKVEESIDSLNLNGEAKQIEEPTEIKNEPQEEKFIQQNLSLAEKLKGEGNQLFKNQEYQKAISKYQQALRYSPVDQKKLKAVIYSNISICLSKGEDYKDSIPYCKKSIENDPTYLKARLNLASAYQKVDNPEEALAQYQKIVQANPKEVKYIQKVKQLQKAVAQLNQKRKNEVLSGLKTIGNSFLGMFGMSLDNFKLQQGANGGYNVSFQK